MKKLDFFGLSKILSYVKPHIKLIYGMIFFGLGVSFIDTLVPLFQKYALDNFVETKSSSGIIPFLLFYLAVILIVAGMNYVSTRLSFNAEMLIKRDLRNQAFNHLQTLGFSYFNTHNTGYVHSRIMSDLTNVGQLISWKLMDGVSRLAYLLGAIAVMLSINWKLTLMLLAILPVLTFLFAFFQNRYLKTNRIIRKINSKITNNFNEEITGIKTVKTLAIEGKLTEQFKNDTLEMKQKSVHRAHLSGIFTGFAELATSLALAIVLWKGGAIAQTQIGTFSLFIAYAQGMIEPLRWVVESVSEFITTQVNIERVLDLLQTESDVKDSIEVTEKYGDTFNPKYENWEEIKGDIEFQNVTFRYPDGDTDVLENFSLKVPFGTNVAIVGETGAGKSTLINLICRFFEPTQGTVLIDGKDAKTRSQAWLHSSIGYVLQTPHLFSGTLRDNLLYGNPNATDEEIFTALNLASAIETVEKSPDGLDTFVGEGGEMLSAGEKQLISFARAILKNPKILILDEATASVDTVTEQKIQNAMKTVIKGRTSIIVAHRLSTVRNADIILVVKGGKIIEQGTHEQLLDLNGYYYTLYSKQYSDENTENILNSK